MQVPARKANITCIAQVTFKKVRGKRNPKAIPDEIYECMVKIAKGTSLPPAKERTQKDQHMLDTGWRAKGKRDNSSKRG